MLCSTKCPILIRGRNFIEQFQTFWHRSSQLHHLFNFIVASDLYFGKCNSECHTKMNFSFKLKLQCLVLTLTMTDFARSAKSCKHLDAFLLIINCTKCLHDKTISKKLVIFNWKHVIWNFSSLLVANRLVLLCQNVPWPKENQVTPTLSTYYD